MGHTTILAVCFGLATAMGWGLSDFWSARAAKVVGPVTALFYINLAGIGAYGIFFAVLHPHVHLTMAGLGYTVASGVGITVAASLFYKGLAAGPVSLVSPITAAYPLVSALMAVAIFKARLSLAQGGAIVVIVTGVMIASGLANIKKSDRRLEKGPLYALSSIVFYGAGFACSAQAVQRIGWELPLLVSWSVSLPLLLLPLFKGSETILANAKTALTNRYLLGAGLVAVAAYTVFNIGFAYDTTAGSLTIAVSACYPALTMTLALRHFKEELRYVPLLGAVATIAGVVILSVS